MILSLEKKEVEIILSWLGKLETATGAWPLLLKINEQHARIPSTVTVANLDLEKNEIETIINWLGQMPTSSGAWPLLVKISRLYEKLLTNTGHISDTEEE